jgi:ketosteroid isomerase-like protein
MSESLDLVRAIYAEWERGEFRSADWAHPVIEWEAVGGPEPSSGTGIASLDAAWRGFLAAWADYRVLAEEYRELDDERVLVLLTAYARGRASGLEAEGGDTLGANLMYVRDGKVTRFVTYWDRDRALADLGLTE